MAKKADRERERMRERAKEIERELPFLNTQIISISLREDLFK